MSSNGVQWDMLTLFEDVSKANSDTYLKAYSHNLSGVFVPCIKCLARLLIILMHRSIGGAHRNSLVSNLSPESQMRNILQNMDGTEDEQKDFFDLLNKHLPEEWNIVGISVCPTGELLFSSIRKCGDGNIQGCIECIFSKNGQQIDFRKCLVQKMNIILQVIHKIRIYTTNNNRLPCRRSPSCASITQNKSERYRIRRQASFYNFP